MGAALIPAAAIGAVGSLIGGYSANKQSVAQSREQRTFESQEAATARDFEERMSNTSWQRGVADMRKAGINPALSYMQGGAGAPSASAPSGATADIHDVISPAISSALQGIRVVQDVKNMNEQIKLIAAQRDKASMETESERMVGLDKQYDMYMKAAVLRGMGFKVPDSISIGRLGLASTGGLSGESLDEQRKQLELQLRRFDIPAAQSSAKFYGKDDSILSRILGGIRATVGAYKGK